MSGGGGRCSREAIEDEDILLRRVVVDPPYMKLPEGRPSSMSYSLRPGETGLSVDVERMTSHATAIKDERRYRLFGHTAGAVRALLLCVCHDPCPPEDPGNEAHALITTAEGRPADCEDETCLQEGAPAKLTKALARKLAMNSVPVNYPVLS